MTRAVIVGLGFSLAACAGGGARASADLATQVRALHDEQAQQARRMELLEQRVILAEDTARSAREALTAAARARPTVRIAPEVPAPVDEPIPSATSLDDDGPGADDPAPRPVVRAAGRDARAPASPPFVVHDPERLPVAPMPPALEPAPARPAPGRALPESTSRVLPGVSSARDPRAAPAYEAALALARGHRCGEAVNALSAFLVRWPDHPFADHAMYWRGQCLRTAGDAAAATREFEGLLARFPMGAKAPDALFALASCYRQRGDAALARATVARLQREFPASALASRARDEEDR